MTLIERIDNAVFATLRGFTAIALGAVAAALAVACTWLLFALGVSGMWGYAALALLGLILSGAVAYGLCDALPDWAWFVIAEFCVALAAMACYIRTPFPTPF